MTANTVPPQVPSGMPWGSDVQISMPDPMDHDTASAPYVDMGGFRFTEKGLQVDVTATDIDAMLARRYRPYMHDEQRDDLQEGL